MCGIAGILSLKKSQLDEVNSGELKVLLNSMEHRGPDGADSKQFMEFMFGMRRLAIIDISGGMQPISNEDDTLWVTMNGELYNYVELREFLLRKGHLFKTHTDTEVILHLYEEYGESFVEHLNGMFAICLYDTKKDAVYLFRDRMGIKPLFYAEKNDKLYFSSDLKGLASVLQSKYSRNAIGSYLFLSYIPKPDTAYEGIHKLMPAQALKIDRKRNFLLYTYWQIPQHINHSITFEEASRRLEELLLDANKIQLRTDTEFAISLSGGIDSSTVLAFASASYKRPLNTISIDYADKAGSQDGQFAREIAEKFRTNHTNILVRREQFLGYLKEMMPKIDEPISDSALIPTYIVSKEARNRNIKVLLSGAGGDELFGGYHRHWRPSCFTKRGLTLYPKSVRSLLYTGLNMAGIDNNNLRLLDNRIAFASDINGINYGFLRKSSREEFFEVQMQTLREHYRFINFKADGFQYNKMYHDAENYLVDNILSLGDKAAMATSVEGRFPLIDHRIIELAFTLPADINLYKGQPKGLLKEVIKPYVPEAVLTRKKEGFNAPVNAWFNPASNGGVYQDLLNGIEQYLPDIIDVDQVRAYVSASSSRAHIFENLYNIFLLIEWFKSR